jgi:hypothetical protein
LQAPPTSRNTVITPKNAHDPSDPSRAILLRHPTIDRRPTPTTQDGYRYVSCVELPRAPNRDPYRRGRRTILVDLVEGAVQGSGASVRLSVVSRLSFIARSAATRRHRSVAAGNPVARRSDNDHNADHPFDMHVRRAVTSPFAARHGGVAAPYLGRGEAKQLRRRRGCDRLDITRIGPVEVGRMIFHSAGMNVVSTATKGFDERTKRA